MESFWKSTANQERGWERVWGERGRAQDAWTELHTQRRGGYNWGSYSFKLRE